jgi:hypothetical protein
MTKLVNYVNKVLWICLQNLYETYVCVLHHAQLRGCLFPLAHVDVHCCKNSAHPPVTFTDLFTHPSIHLYEVCLAELILTERCIKCRGYAVSIIMNNELDARRKHSPLRFNCDFFHLLYYSPDILSPFLQILNNCFPSIFIGTVLFSL